MAIKFGEGRPEDKPSQAVIDKLKDAGYRWNPAHKIWTYPVRADSALRTRIDAERLYLPLSGRIPACIPLPGLLPRWITIGDHRGLFRDFYRSRRPKLTKGPGAAGIAVGEVAPRL